MPGRTGVRYRQAQTHAVGDICSRYFAADGAPVPYPGEERLLALTRDQLTAAGTVVDVLVTEANTARALLAAAATGR